MTKDNRSQSDAKGDLSTIRPSMRIDDIKLLRGEKEPSDRSAVKKALRTLHTLELMAVNIYKFQITNKPTELDRRLIAAMCNEMTHFQDFQIKLYEYGFRPSIFRWVYWIVGFVFGTVSRMLGKKAILKTAIWVESKAVEHYSELLEKVPWDSETRKIVEKNQSDEYGHIKTWQEFLSTE